MWTFLILTLHTVLIQYFNDNYHGIILFSFTRLHAFGGVGVNITIDEQRIDPGAKWESAPPDGSYGWLNDHLEFSLNLSEK